MFLDFIVSPAWFARLLFPKDQQGKELPALALPQLLLLLLVESERRSWSIRNAQNWGCLWKRPLETT
jgi:hypothetical protein